MCEALIPVSGEIGITVAFEIFLGIRFEANSQVTCLFQVSYEVQYCFSMRFSRIGRILGNLMGGIHDVRARSLG